MECIQFKGCWTSICTNPAYFSRLTCLDDCWPVFSLLSVAALLTPATVLYGLPIIRRVTRLSDEVATLQSTVDKLQSARADWGIERKRLLDEHDTALREARRQLSEAEMRATDAVREAQDEARKAKREADDVIAKLQVHIGADCAR